MISSHTFNYRAMYLARKSHIFPDGSENPVPSICTTNSRRAHELFHQVDLTVFKEYTYLPILSYKTKLILQFLDILRGNNFISLMAVAFIFAINSPVVK